MSKLSSSDEQFLHRLNAHPVLKARMTRLLDVVENTSGDLKRADAAEQRAIEEMRQMGLEVLENWAAEQIDQCTEATAGREGVQRRGKKSTALAL